MSHEPGGQDQEAKSIALGGKEGPPGGSRRRGASTRTFELTGDALKRPPQGDDADHALVEDLKRKDFVAVTSFPEEEVLQEDFLEWFAGVARTGAPFVELLSNAVGVDF